MDGLRVRATVFLLTREIQQELPFTIYPSGSFCEIDELGIGRLSDARRQIGSVYVSRKILSPEVSASPLSRSSSSASVLLHFFALLHRPHSDIILVFLSGYHSPHPVTTPGEAARRSLSQVAWQGKGLSKQAEGPIDRLSVIHRTA